MGLRQVVQATAGYLDSGGACNPHSAEGTVRYGEEPGRDQSRVMVVPSTTDNKANNAVLNKLLTTKFPASAVLMELAVYMKKMSLRTVVEWSPRTGKQEADRLANGDHSGFAEEHRIKVTARSLVLDMLPKTLIIGATAEQERDAAGTLPNRSREEKRKPPEDRVVEFS